MQTLQHLDEHAFLGMNDRYPSHELPKGVFQLVQNAVVDSQKISKRKGASIVAPSLGAFDLLGGEAFEPSGGTKIIIVCRNGSSNAQLYSWAGSGSFGAIGSANLTKDAQMNFVQAANYLFGFNGAEVVDIASDGTTVTRNRSSVPKGSFGFWYHNFLFVGGVTGNPNRLYFSNLGDPTTFSGTDFIDINANDGDSLTGLAGLYDKLIIFKNNSIWAITGFSSSTFVTDVPKGVSTNNLNNGYGTPSHRSIVTVGKEIYYLSFLGGIPHFRALTLSLYGTLVDGGLQSLDIETTLKGINLAKLSKCAGAYDGKYLRWAVPNTSSTTNNLVLVFEPTKSMIKDQIMYRSWVEWTGMTPNFYLTSTLSGQAKIYFGDATTGGYVFLEAGSTYDDNGTTVTMDVRTRDIMFDQAKKTKFKYMFHKYSSGSSGTLQVNARIDRATDFGLQESVSLMGNSPGLGPTGTFTLGVSVLGGVDISANRVTFAHLTGHLLGVQFKEATAHSCDLYEYSIYGSSRGLRDS